MKIRVLAIVSMLLDLTINARIFLGDDKQFYCVFSCKYMPKEMAYCLCAANNWEQAAYLTRNLLHIFCGSYELSILDRFSPMPPDLKYLEAEIPKFVNLLKLHNPERYARDLEAEKKRHMAKN